MGRFNLMPVSGHIDERLVTAADPLKQLLGNWRGKGFNQIWRPANSKTSPGELPPGQDRFLELNETLETLSFSEVSNNVPNRGLNPQLDISLLAIDYLQQISDANVKDHQGHPAGLHFEPGLWVSIPASANPAIAVDTFARMASIPHGTTFTAQGTAFTVAGPPVFKPVSITPFLIGNPAQTFNFPESTLTNPTAFRTPAADIPHVTQDMVNDPNSVLAAGIVGKNIISTTVLSISTIPLNPPPSGGGTANISYLLPNAFAAQVDAIFWIETILHPAGHHTHQLQYTQTVLLNFNGLSWPHVSVATLEK